MADFKPTAPRKATDDPPPPGTPGWAIGFGYVIKTLLAPGVVSQIVILATLILGGREIHNKTEDNRRELDEVKSQQKIGQEKLDDIKVATQKLKAPLE